MTQGNYAVHIWLHKYIFFNNGGSKMDKDTNVFGPVILEGDTPGLEYEYSDNPRPSDDSHGDLD